MKTSSAIASWACTWATNYNTYEFNPKQFDNAPGWSGICSQWNHGIAHAAILLGRR